MRTKWLLPILTTILLFSHLILFAQNQIIATLQVLPPYPNKISAYEDPGKFVIMLKSNSRSQLNIQLRGAITGENGIEIRASEQFKSPQPIVLNAFETKNLNGYAIRDLFDINKVTVTGITKNELARGNGLPEGIYRVCIRAYDYFTNAPLSQDEPLGCSNLIRITNLEPPILIRPFFDETVKATAPQNVLFTWSFPAGAPPTTRYRLKIVEIFNNTSNINDAMLSSTTPSFFEQEVSANAFLYGPAQPTLIQGRKYAFMVTAFDPLGQAVFRNDGRSEISTFTYGTISAPAFPDISKFKVMAAPGPFTCACLQDLPGGKPDNSKATTGSKIAIGKFEMTILNVAEEGGLLKGRGKINFPVINSKLIPILVEFSDLQVNSANQALGGTVKAQVKDDVDFLPKVPGPNLQTLPFSAGDVQKLDDYFKANTQNLVSNINSSMANAGFELPLGIDKTIGGAKTVIAITGATFTPVQATFEASTVVNLPDGGTKVALGARNICMDETGMCGQGTLFLAEDFDISAIHMKLKGASAAFVNPLDSGTYVTFDNNGFKSIRIQAEYAFPATLIVRKSDKASQVKAIITATAESWSNWIANVAIDPFYLAGTTDFGFTLSGNGFYDHSSKSNPEGMPTIEGKTNINTADWNGFLLQDVSVELPSIIKKINSSEPITANMKNLIVDNQGVSGSIAAVNILNIGDGDMGGWYYSVDQIGANFLNNSFVSGGMEGQVILPISGNNPANPNARLDYTSTLSKPEGILEFQFVIKPKANIDVPLWYSKFTIANTSSIKVTNETGKFYASANLNGDMSITGSLSPLAKIDFKAMEFEGLKVQTMAPYLSVEKFHAGSASPDKSLSGFPIQLKSISPEIGMTNAGLKFDMKISLCDIPTIPTADFGFTLNGKLDFNKGRPDWKYDGLSLKELNLAGHIGPVDVNGGVSFFDSGEFGNGISGTLEARMISGFSTKAQVLFGHTSFYYWYVDVRQTLPPPGIAFASPIPLSVMGFGGGAFYHLSQKKLLDPKTLYSTKTPELTNLYTPDANSCGFKATMILGTSDGTLYQAAGTFETSLNERTMAPILMKLTVDAAMLSPMMETQNAFAKGTGVIQYDFANDVFDAAIGANLSVAKLLEGHGFVHLNIDGKNKLWFLKIGEPADRISLQLLSFVNFDAYVMAGNSQIPGIPDPPYEVKSKISGYAGDRTGISQGLALGFGGSLSYGPADLEFLIFYMKLGAGLGFDVSLRKNIGGCEWNPNPGVNGYYAVGQWYMWAQFAFGVNVDVWFYTGKIAVAELEMAALLKGGIPNPTWFDGWLYGSYNVLGGLVSGNMNFHVEVGEKCIPKSDPFGGMPLISEIKPTDKEKPQKGFSIMADPQAAFNFPINSPFTINTVDDKGNNKNRTFIIKLSQFDVLRLKTGTIDVSTIKNRVFKVSGGDRLATLYPNFAFEPQEKYKITVKVQAFEITNGVEIPVKNKNNADVIEEKSEYFTTGECIEKLDGSSVLASYPIANQRYFLQDDSPKGFLELKSGVPCLLTESQYDMIAVFTSFQSRYSFTTYEAPVVYDGRSTLNFAIPRLPNSQIVELKIVKRRKASGNLTQAGMYSKAFAKTLGNEPHGDFAYEENNKYIDQYNIVHVRSGSIQGISETFKKIPDIVLYKYYFKTSKFNSLTEKIARSEVSSTAKKTAIGLVELYDAEYKLEEGFDRIDVYGQKFYGLGGTYKIGPLVLASESNPRNSWSENYIRNGLYLNWSKGYYGGFTEELSPRYVRPFSVPVLEALFFVPPSVPIDFNLTSIDPPLSTAEINTVKGGDFNSKIFQYTNTITPKVALYEK